MSYERDSFADLVGQQVADAREAVASNPRDEDQEWWDAQVEKAYASAERRRRAEPERLRRQAIRAEPIMALGREFARTLLQSGVSFDVLYPPSRKSVRQRERSGLPPELPAWTVAEQQRTVYVAPARKNIMRGGEELTDGGERLVSRGIAIARDGRFMSQGIVPPELRGYPDSTTWQTVDVSVRQPYLMSHVATPDDIVLAPGVPRLQRPQNPVNPPRELDDIDRLFLEPATQETPPIDDLYGSWKAHLVTVASRIIVAHQAG